MFESCVFTINNVVATHVADKRQNFRGGKDKYTSKYTQQYIATGGLAFCDEQ